MEGQQPSPDELQTGEAAFTGAADLQVIAEEAGLTERPQDEPTEDFFDFQEDQVEVTDKRFALSAESFAKERLATVRSEVATLKEQYPEAVGFTMFGSMVRGRATEASDVDGYIFIDATIAQQRYPNEQIMHEVNGEPRLVPSMEDGYAAGIRTALQERNGLTPELTQEIRVLPISKEIIDQEVDVLAEQIQAYDKYLADYDEYLGSDADAIPPEAPETPIAPRNLYAMFHLEVGRGMTDLRTHLLQRLNQMGDLGQKVWQEIIENTEAMERGRDTEKAAYPVSLKSALKSYAA